MTCRCDADDPCDRCGPTPHRQSILGKHEDKIRGGIVAEMLMRCHALRHENPCPTCGPLIHIARGNTP